MTSRRARLALVAMFVAVVAPSCGGERPAPAPARAPAAPGWADVFDGTPDLFVVLRPRALKRDPVYGNFWKALMRAAEARGLARGETMVRAVEGSDEVIVGLSRGLDAALVLRGVPASVDPERLLDAKGQPLVRPVRDRGKIAEYDVVDRTRAGGAGLFVLPERTWAFAVGDARTRARVAFERPSGRPGLTVDPDALVVVRAAGGMVRALERHPSFGVLAKKVTSATFSLAPGKGGVVIALRYADAADAAWAEMHAKQLVAELSRDGRHPWLADAKVAYEGETLSVRVAVPPRLLEELPSASGADLGL